MSPAHSNDPLHGITLEAMLEELVARHGWPELGKRIPIRCFTHEPSIKSSLKFLRRTEWGRVAVERLYLADQREIERKRKRNQERAARRAHAASQEVLSQEGLPQEGLPQEAPSVVLREGEHLTVEHLEHFDADDLRSDRR